MSMTDPIADMLTRIRNANSAYKATTTMPSSKKLVEIARIMKEEGYIEGFDIVDGDRPQVHTLRLRLKYVGERRQRQPVITGLERISRPGRRVYTRKQDIPWVLSGIGISILSTPKGVMTGARARQLNVGGELLCKVW